MLLCLAYFLYLTLALFSGDTIDASNRVTKTSQLNLNADGFSCQIAIDAKWETNNAFRFTGEDEQLDEERDLIIKEIEKLVRLSV